MSENPCEDCDGPCDFCDTQRELIEFERKCAEKYAGEIGEHLPVEERRDRAIRLWPLPDAGESTNLAPLPDELAGKTIRMWRVEFPGYRSIQ